MSLNMIVSKTLPLARRTTFVNQIRKVGYGQEGIAVASPPTVRIPFAEKVVLGTLMCASILAIPAWVLLNVKNYNANKGEEE